MQTDNEVIKRVGERLDVCEELVERITKEMKEDAPQLVNKGNFIR